MERYFVCNGQSEYCVLLPENPTRAIEKAAEQLVRFVQECSGAVLPIVLENEYTGGKKVFSIGKTEFLKSQQIPVDYHSLNGDGFLLKTVDGDVITDAACARGFLYAVYEFLERVFGVRFFYVGITKTPQNKRVVLPNLDVLEIPAFALRTFLTSGTHDDKAELNQEYASFARTNSTFFTFDEEWGGAGAAFGRLGGQHNTLAYVPMEKWKDTHPEFFFEDPVSHHWTANILNGITPEGKLDETLDVSVAKIVIEEMKKDVLEHPNALFFAFSQEDYLCKMIADSVMEQKYKPAGCFIRFLNVVISELQAWANQELDGRKINIYMLGYGPTSEPPIREENGKLVPIDETVIPHENVYVSLCVNGQNSYYSLFEQDGVEKKLIEKWSVLGVKFMFWAYVGDYTDYLSYNVGFRTIPITLRGMSRLTNGSIVYCAPYKNRRHWQYNMYQYVGNKLLWNPLLDAETLKEEYIEFVYGITSPCVRKIFALMDGHYASYMKPEIAIGAGNYNRAATYPNITAELCIRMWDFVKEGQNVIEVSSLPEKEKQVLRERMWEIQVTPMWMLLNNYRQFFPTHSERQKLRLLNEWYDVAAHKLSMVGGGSFSEHQNLSDVYWRLRFRETEDSNLVDKIYGRIPGDTDETYYAEWNELKKKGWKPEKED